MNEAEQKLALVDESKLTGQQKSLVQKLRTASSPTLDGRLEDVLLVMAKSGQARTARRHAPASTAPPARGTNRAPAAGRLASDDLF